MPSDFGISDLIVEEWYRFTSNLSNLTDGGQEEARKRAARRDPSKPDVRAVNIPGWDDIIHAVPRPEPTRAEREAHYAAKRAGQASPLGDDLAFEVERRGRKAQAIQQSTSPAWAAAYGQVMTALDNVQDLLTTVATVGRITVNPAIRGAEALAASRFATAKVAGQVGGKLLQRAIPGIGWVLLGADLLKLTTQIGMLAFPAYAVLCSGPRAGLAAAVPALLMGPALCKPIGAWSKINPFGRKASLSRSRLARNWRPSVSNLIEVAQTTDALFGVGLSVGAVVGTVQDAAFGIEQSRRGVKVEVSTTMLADSAHRVYSGQLARETTAALHDLRTSANVLAHGVTLHGVQDVFTFEEHLESLMATSAAMSTLQPYLAAPELVELVNLVADVDLDPPAYLEHRSRGDLEAQGMPWPEARRWPFPGAPRAVNGADLMEIGAALVPRALRELLEPRRDTIGASFAGSVVNRITERSAIWLTGSDDAITYRDEPVYQIMTSLALANRWPNAGAGEDALVRFFQLSATQMHRERSNSLDAKALDSIAKTTGLPLLRGLPPDAPYPAGIF